MRVETSAHRTSLPRRATTVVGVGAVLMLGAFVALTHDYTPSSAAATELSVAARNSGAAKGFLSALHLTGLWASPDLVDGSPASTALGACVNVFPDAKCNTWLRQFKAKPNWSTITCARATVTWSNRGKGLMSEKCRKACGCPKPPPPPPPPVPPPAPGACVNVFPDDQCNTWLKKFEANPDWKMITCARATVTFNGEKGTMSEKCRKACGCPTPH